MSNDPSRKQFFAKLLGVTAVAGLAPKLFAKSASAAVGAPATDSKAPRFQLRTEARAVSRRADSV